MTSKEKVLIEKSVSRMILTLQNIIIHVGFIVKQLNDSKSN